MKNIAGYFKSLRRESLLFLCSLCALCVVFFVWHFFYARQKVLQETIGSMEKQIVLTSKQLTELNKTARTIKTVLWKDPKKKVSRQDLGEIIKELARNNHFLQLQFSFMPERISYQDSSLSITKTLIHLQFAACFDGHIWDFLRELYQHCPGIVQAKELQMDKELLSEQEEQFLGTPAIIKGVYKFEWYTLSSLSSSAY